MGGRGAGREPRAARLRTGGGRTVAGGGPVERAAADRAADALHHAKPPAGHAAAHAVAGGIGSGHGRDLGAGHAVRVPAPGHDAARVGGGGAPAGVGVGTHARAGVAGRSRQQSAGNQPPAGGRRHAPSAGHRRALARSRPGRAARHGVAAAGRCHAGAERGTGVRLQADRLHCRPVGGREQPPVHDPSMGCAQPASAARASTRLQRRADGDVGRRPLRGDQAGGRSRGRRRCVVGRLGSRLGGRLGRFGEPHPGQRQPCGRCGAVHRRHARGDQHRPLQREVGLG